MIGAVARYFAVLIEGFGQGWNRFWYAPRDVYTLSVLRILTGLLALWIHLSYSPDLVRWFGPRGLLPVDAVRSIASGGAEDGGIGQVTYLQLTDSPVGLWTLHVVGAVVLLMFTAGCLTRLSSILAFVVLLANVHRGPMIAGQVETVVTMLVAYLCLAPTGRCLSVDRWWRRRAQSSAATAIDRDGDSPPRYVSAAISMRLIQFHTAAIYVMMALTQLGGMTWWSGEAYWWLIAQADSPLVDLTFLRDHSYVVNVLTHLTVTLELMFAVLIWNPTARPLLLSLAVVMWILLALVTGLVSFAVAMVVAGLAFVPSATVRAIFTRHRKAKESVVDSSPAHAS